MSASTIQTSFRSRAALVSATIVLAASRLALAATPADPFASAPTGINALQLQVAALNQINDLDLSHDQLKELRRLLPKEPAAYPTPSTTAPTTAPAGFAAALRSLRDALVAGDDDKIDAAQDEVDSIRDAQHLETPDFPIDTTLKVGKALDILSASQIAGYIAERADDVPSAQDTIDDAMDQCRSVSEANYPALRKEAADQLALLVGGWNGKNSKSIAQKTSDLLDECRKMSDDDYQSKLDSLESRAKKIITGTDSFSALRHWMDREMADLLSNPATPAAIDARLAVPES